MQKTTSRRITLAAVWTLCLFLLGNAQAQTASMLYVFTNAANGSYPNAILVQGRDGELYGTTGEGGANTCTFEGQTYGCGAIFKVDTSGNLTLLHSFDGSDGLSPAGVTLGTDGNFYGTAYGGGSNNLGTLYKITSSGEFTKLHDFANGSDGEYPAVQLLQASDGNLYGFSKTGLFRATTSGTVTTIFTFSPPPMYASAMPLIQATNGYLYETFPSGYCNGSSCPCGAFVKFSLQGARIWEHDFGCLGVADGDYPGAPYIQASDGNFYGTNVYGGSGQGEGQGTAVKVDAKMGMVTVLYDFNYNAGYPESGLTQGSDGNFYGAATLSTLGQAGSAYQLTAAGGFNQFVALPYVDDGYPSVEMVQHTNGKFYGSVPGGEQGNYYGSIYAVDNGLGPFITFVSPQGRVGSRAQFLGQGLMGATAVTFNGVAASTFAVVSDTFMTALVPEGATTGVVVVTTPGGMLNSNKSFRVSLY
jgi:uncharacterized repeat protein (TIGR03803 family)